MDNLIAWMERVGAGIRGALDGWTIECLLLLVLYALYPLGFLVILAFLIAIMMRA